MLNWPSFGSARSRSQSSGTVGVVRLEEAQEGVSDFSMRYNLFIGNTEAIGKELTTSQVTEIVEETGGQQSAIRGLLNKYFRFTGQMPLSQLMNSVLVT